MTSEWADAAGHDIYVPSFPQRTTTARRGNQVPLGTIRVSEICHGIDWMAESRPGAKWSSV